MFGREPVGYANMALEEPADWVLAQSWKRCFVPQRGHGLRHRTPVCHLLLPTVWSAPHEAQYCVHCMAGCSFCLPVQSLQMTVHFSLW